MTRLVGVVSILLMITACAQAQKSTERYIPIGKSPGLSGKHTLIGSIVEVNTTEKSLKMMASDGIPYTVRVNDKTKFWSDRSAVRKTNETISFDQCAANMRAEVKYVNNERVEGGIAEWIKVEMR